MEYLGSLVAMIISEIAILVTFFLIITKQKNKSQLKTAMICWLGCTFLWTLGSIVQILFQKSSIDPFFWEKFAGIGVHYCPVAFLALSVIFAKTKIKIRWYHCLLLVVPFITDVLTFTNESHHLIFEVYSPDVTKMVYGSWFNVHTIYTYSLILVGLVYCLRYSFKHSGFFSRQSLLIILGITVPLVLNVLATLNIIPLTTYTTPISFAFMGVIYAFAIFRFQFLKVTPIALQRIVNRISDSYLVLNEYNDIIDFNAAFLNTFKVNTDNLRNKRLMDILKDNKEFNVDISILSDTINKCKNSTETFTFEKYFNPIDRYFNIEINSIFSKSTYLGTLVLFKDITQHMKDQETIRNQAKFAIIGKLAGGMAHDINNPAGSIKLAVNALYKITDTEEKKEVLDSVSDSIDRIIVLANSTLNQMKNFGSTMKQKFTIKDLMEEIKLNSEIKNRLRESNCNLNLLINDETEIYGEKLKLNQVVTNMITNSILCYQERKKEGDINIGLLQNDDYYIISVEDNAGGIPEHVQEVLLKDIFTTRGTKGTGVGLYLGNSVIQESFKGEITYKTEIDKGTTFYVSILKKAVTVENEKKVE